MNKLQVALQQIELTLVTVAGQAGPLLAPVPTAYLVYAATLEHLAWPWSVAVVAALIIECLGLASTGLVLELYDYNKRKLKSEPEAPVLLAGVLVGAYFIVATGLTVMLDLYTNLAKFAPAIFPALSLAGVSILAIRSDHRQRVAQNAQDKADRAAKRAPKKAPKRVPNESTHAAQEHVADDVQTGGVSAHSDAQNAALAHINASRKQTKAERMESLVRAYADNPALGATAVGELLGIHRNTVYNYTTELVEAGRIKKNGSGYKVTSQEGER